MKKSSHTRRAALSQRAGQRACKLCGRRSAMNKVIDEYKLRVYKCRYCSARRRWDGKKIIWQGNTLQEQ